jgi:putative ABC transport system permease protein
MMTVTAMVLLVATVNLTGLLRAKAAARRREVAVRFALGASKWRATREVLIENLLLSMAGAAAGLGVALVLVRTLVLFVPAYVAGRGRVPPFSMSVSLDLHVLSFTAAVCVLTVLLTGSDGARQVTKAPLSHRLVADPVSARLSYWILAPQICFSLALLLAAGLLVRTLLDVQTTDRGYNPDQVVLVDYQLPVLTRALWSSDKAEKNQALAVLKARRSAFDMRLLQRLDALPAITSSALVGDLPWERVHLASVVRRQDYGNAMGGNRWVAMVEAAPGYFATFGIPILRGRTFGVRDATRRVGIVSEDLAALLWPDSDAIGQYLAHYDPKYGGEPQWNEVVGVAKAVRPPLADARPRPTVYFPFQPGSASALTVAVRGREGATATIALVKETIRSTDPSALILDAASAMESIDRRLFRQRVAVGLLGGCGLVSLFLAAVGVYGAASYSAAHRVREFGVRAALGATGRDLVTLILRQGMRIVIVGSVPGIVLALAAIRLSSSLVARLPAVEPVTFICVPLVFALVILVACYVPARRAGRIDPLTALREE